MLFNRSVLGGYNTTIVQCRHIDNAKKERNVADEQMCSVI